MSLTSRVFAEIRSQCRKKSVTLADLIDDVDLKGTGKIVTNRFMRIFNLLGIWMDSAKFSELVSIYRIEGTDLIDISRFLSDYESPSANVALVTDSELRDFAKRFVIRNTTLQEIVRPFDRFHSGHVPIDGFLAAVGTSPLTKRIAEQYSHPPTNDVYYIDLANDFNRVLREQPLRESTLSLTMSKLPAYFKDIARTIRLNGVDPYHVLSVHDKLKKSTILPSHFMSDAGALGLHLNERQLNEITDAFSTYDNRFDYVSFCDAIQVENDNEIREINERTAAEVKQVPTANVNDVLKRLESEIQDRHSLVTDKMASYDVAQTGKLSERLFFKTLELEKFDLTTDERKALIDEFSDGDGNMNIKSFSYSVVPPQKSLQPELNSIIERLKQYLDDRKIQIKPMFEKLDSERKGWITFNQLLSIFRNVQFDIDIRERRILKNETTDCVNTESFCALVDPVLPQINMNTHKEEEEKHEPEIPSKQVMDALARVYSVVSHEDVDLKTEFQRYESSPFIRPYTFRTALISLPVHISENDIDLFMQVYQDRLNRIDSNRFINDVNSFGQDQLKITPNLSLTATEFFNEPNEEVKSILRRLKAVFRQRNISGMDLFRPYDPSLYGTVSKDRLRAIFSFIGFEIAPNELLLLQNAFQSSRMPDQFNYRRMIAVLEQQEVQKEDLTSIKIPHSSSNIGDYALVSLINTIHSKLQARRKYANCVFSDCPDAPIPVYEFRKRISDYGLIITQADIQLLIRSYRANLNGDIDWRGFCQDVDTIKTVQPPR